ncbi:MAG: hypothetical protein WKG00_16385 [Polyangiaceae bacterium]
MNAALPGLKRLAEAWTEELSRALAERSAWAHLGTVEVAAHRGKATLGGWIDRRVVPTGDGPPAEALEAWRRTSEGRIIDRALAQANGALQALLPDPDATLAAGEPWLDAAAVLAGDGALVALGAPADLVVLTRAALGSPWRARLHACPTESKAGRVRLCAGSPGACVMVAMVGIAPGPGGVHVITVVDVKSKGQSRLARLDVRTAT